MNKTQERTFQNEMVIMFDSFLNPNASCYTKS